MLIDTLPTILRFCLRFAEPHSLAAGTEVEVWLFDGTRENFNDLNQVSGLPLENIINQKQSSIHVFSIFVASYDSFYLDVLCNFTVFDLFYVSNRF